MGIGRSAILPIAKLPASAKGIVSPSSGGRSWTPQYKSVLAAMTEQPSMEDQLLYNNFVKSLLSAGIWQKLDLLRVYGNANDTDGAALLNWINPTANKATANVAYTFEAKEGITSGGSAFYLNSQWSPSEGVNYKQNSASIGFFSFTDNSGSFFETGLAGTYPAVFGARLSGNYYLKLNDNTAIGTPAVANDNSMGFYVTTRTGATRKIYKNGEEKYSANVASLGVSNLNTFEFAYNNSGTAAFNCVGKKLGLLFYGGYLTPEEISSFTTIVNNFFFSMNSVNASTFGFSTGADAATNTAALQDAIDGGFKEVVINAGTYELNDTILIDSYTKIRGIGNVILKKSSNYCTVFLNRGATTLSFNDSIYIENITIDTNGTIADPTLVYGLRAHVGFYKIRDLHLSDINIINGANHIFAVYIVDFEKVRIDSVYIPSEKDGINFAKGNDAIISNCVFETRDDASALATIGYPLVCVAIGDISNISYINCRDNTASHSDVGYFCRIMGASWEAWGAGKQYQQGDVCVNGGNLYQVNNVTGFTVDESVNAPVHTTGEVTGVDDGITWRYKHAAPANNYTTVSGITFTNIIKEKKRPLVYGDISVGSYLRYVYPGTESLSTITDVVIDGCSYSDFISGYFIQSDGTFLNIAIRNSLIKNAAYVYYNNGIRVFERNLEIEITNCQIIGEGGYFRAKQEVEHIYCYGSGNYVDQPKLLYKAPSGENSTIRIDNDTLLLYNGHQNYLSPEIGDRCLTTVGIYEYTAEGWELQA